MSTMLRGMVAIAVLALSGCATVSRNECRTGDWFDIGVRDGARGWGEERFLDDAKACARHGLAADREAWLQGRERGLERYCTARNGFDVGAQGGSYGGVCPRLREDEFLHGYSLGQDLAQVRAEMARRDHRIHELRERLEPHRDGDDRDGGDHRDGTGRDRGGHSAQDERRDHEPLSDKERIALAIELGVHVARREDLRREVLALEQRGREL
ncbi:MAG: DUF2799 domain-containing protein [Steroidobacteraceae bacterium]